MRHLYHTRGEGARKNDAASLSHTIPAPRPSTTVTVTAATRVKNFMICVKGRTEHDGGVRTCERDGRERACVRVLIRVRMTRCEISATRGRHERARAGLRTILFRFYL